LYEDEFVNEEGFNRIFRQLRNSRYLHKVIVVEDRRATHPRNKIIGTGTIYIKPDMIFKNGAVANVEDIALRNITDALTAQKIITCLLWMSCEFGCEKIVTTTKDINKPFYRDYGFCEKDSALEYTISTRDQQRMLEKQVTTKRGRAGSIQEKDPVPQHSNSWDCERDYQSSEPPQ